MTFSAWVRVGLFTFLAMGALAVLDRLVVAA